MSHEGRDTSYLFPLKYCGHRRLENGKAIGRIIDILLYIKQYLKELKEKKVFPENNDRFLLVYQMVNLSAVTNIGVFKIHYECYGTVSNPPSSRMSTLFLQEHLTRLIISQMNRFVCPAVLESVSSTKKLMMIDLSNKGNLLPDESVDVDFGTTKALKKLKMVQSPEVRNFRKEVQNFMVKSIEKLRERSHLKFEVFSTTLT